MNKIYRKGHKRFTAKDAKVAKGIEKQMEHR